MNKIQDIEEQEKLKSLVPELNKKFSDAPAEDIVGYFLQAFKGASLFLLPSASRTRRLPTSS